MEAYLDNAATTRVFPEVREKMVRVMEEDFGNPSSKHTKGMDAEKYIRETKEILAKDLKCTPGEIIFTSGGTESNNTALIGGAYANRRAGKHIITTRIEHASVHEPLAFLEELGYQVTYLPVDKNGQVSPSELEKALTEETILVSIMLVNNEIGAVEDVKTLSEIVHSYNPKILFHVDAIQAYGKYHIVPKRLGIDLMSVSGHKLHGPKGVGFLYMRDKAKVRPLIYGTGMPLASAVLALSTMPSNTILPLYWSFSDAPDTAVSNSAYGSAGEMVVHRNAPCSLYSFIVSSSIFAPCSMESTPFSSATFTPSGDSVWAATG